MAIRGDGKSTGATIDWAALHRRVETLGHHLTGDVRSPEQSRRLLEQRAVTLAQRHDPPDQTGTLDVVAFGIDHERYAIEARYVMQIVPRTELSPIPGAPLPVVGVTAWRGGLLTLLDLRAALGLVPVATEGFPWIVVLGRDGAEFGMLVETLSEVTTLAAPDIQPPPKGGAIAPEHLRGMTPDAVLVLDILSLLLRHRPESTGASER